MEIERRQFLRLAAGALALGPLRLATASSAGRWLSCRADLHGRHYFTVLAGDGSVLHDVRLPARGHGIAVRPGTRQCVVLPRRPGTFLWVVDVETGEVVHQRESPQDRHYYGHGAFDLAGRLLYVTENDFEAGRGVIGVYDAADGYRRVAELSSQGVGPHELGFLSDGRTLVVANGGIRTHPDLGRSKLNLQDMAPNLAYVDSMDGRLLDAYHPPAALHRLSIRHLAITPDDKVCVAMQWEGPANVHPPLVAIHRGEERLRLLSAPESVKSAMRNYCGSVCGDSSGEWFAVSAPRGNLITFWSSAGGDCLGRSTVVDGCGIAAGATPGQFTVSSGQGGIFSCRVTGESMAALEDGTSSRMRWDNHMASLLQVSMLRRETPEA